MSDVSIHTVYKPQENIEYLKEWLDYHSNIGINKFYMYDNSYSVYGGFHLSTELSPTEQNKYGHSHKYTIDEAKEIQNEIFKDYDVRLIDWSPTDSNGNITYGQTNAIEHLSTIKDKGLVAFIDIDEFIVKQENFRHSRMLQAKYEDRYYYNSVFEITNGFKIDTSKWASKCIIDMSQYTTPSNIHFPEIDIPISKSFFNHYNHNPLGHRWLLDNYQQIDPSWTPKDYDDVFIEMPSLTELSGFTFDKKS